MWRTFVLGAVAATSSIAGLFFFRFWRTTRDRFFLAFACAFWALALQWTLQAALDLPSESLYYLFTLRLVAFVLILLAIVDKNRRS
jgi:hypothetical protein